MQPASTKVNGTSPLLIILGPAWAEPIMNSSIRTPLTVDAIAVTTAIIAICLPLVEQNQIPAVSAW